MKIENFRHLNFIMVIAFCLFIFSPIAVAFADDLSPEESAFENPTQALRAINLAEAYAAMPDPELEKALDLVNTTEDDLEKAQADLDALDPDNLENEDAIALLKTKIEDLELELKDAQDDVDSRMADDAGVTPEDILMMREEGMGWGEIAHELGLHPGVLGMGHTKRNQNKNTWKKDLNSDGEISDNEIEEATARNFKYGFSKGHGVSHDKGNQGNSGKSHGKKGGKDNQNAGNNESDNGGSGHDKGHKGGKKK